LVIRVAVVLGAFTFAFVRIIVGVVAGVRLAGSARTDCIHCELASGERIFTLEPVAAICQPPT
jgi:hypothetical protein